VGQQCPDNEGNQSNSQAYEWHVGLFSSLKCEAIYGLVIFPWFQSGQLEQCPLSSLKEEDVPSDL